MNNNTDKGLQGNEKIEEAIAGLQKETTQELSLIHISEPTRP